MKDTYNLYLVSICPQEQRGLSTTFFKQMMIQTNTRQTKSLVNMAYLWLFNVFRWVALRAFNSVLESKKRVIVLYVCSNIFQFFSVEARNEEEQVSVQDNGW